MSDQAVPSSPATTRHGDNVLPYARPLDHGRGRAFGWFLAFLFFPYGPFVYLRVLGAIGTAMLGA